MKKRTTSLLLALLMVLTAFVATSCGAPAASPSASPAEEAQTQKVTGMQGVEVELPKEVKTIVDTWSAATDNLFNLGAGDLLVSAHPAAVSEWSERVYPRIAELPDYSKATAEELLELNPDMVIVTSTEKETELRNAGVNAINLMYSTYEGFQQSTAIMGQILGGEYEERAQKLVEYTQWVTDTLAEDLKDVQDEDKPVVHYIMTSDTSNLYASAGGGSIIEEWINYAGGKMATASLGKGMGLKDVTGEQILATDPDVIMIDGDNAAEVRDALKAAPEWADIKAVKNNQIYCIPKGCFWWGRLCGDTPLQALWAASILYPDKVSFDIKEETKKYYKDFKQCELTDEEVDRLLRTELLPE